MPRPACFTVQTRTQQRRRISPGSRSRRLTRTRAGAQRRARLVISIVMIVLVLMPSETEKSSCRNQVISSTCAADLHHNAGVDDEHLKTEFSRSDQQRGQSAHSPSKRSRPRSAQVLAGVAAVVEVELGHEHADLQEAAGADTDRSTKPRGDLRPADQSYRGERLTVSEDSHAAVRPVALPPARETSGVEPGKLLAEVRALGLR